MSLPANSRYYHSYTLNDRLGWASFLSVVLALALLLIVDVVDMNGRKPYHHTIPLPAKVDRVNSTMYVVQDGAITADQLCQGSRNGADRIQISRTLPRLGGQLIQCGHEQYWNDHRAPSPNFGQAAVKVFTNLPADAAIIFLLVLFWQYPLRYQFAWNRASKREQRAREAEEREKAISEQRARELAAAQQQIRFDRLKSELVSEWSKPDSVIDDDAFEQKLADLEAKRERGEL
jgi:hypothetical protein